MYGIVYIYIYIYIESYYLGSSYYISGVGVSCLAIAIIMMSNKLCNGSAIDEAVFIVYSSGQHSTDNHTFHIT